jgi:hypothetical protein
LCKDAERKAEQKIAKDEAARERGDNKWMLPDLGLLSYFTFFGFPWVLFRSRSGPCSDFKVTNSWIFLLEKYT